MKAVRLQVDDKLYFRMKQANYSWNETLAIGFRVRQLAENLGVEQARVKEQIKEVDEVG